MQLINHALNLPRIQPFFKNKIINFKYIFSVALFFILSSSFSQETSTYRILIYESHGGKNERTYFELIINDKVNFLIIKKLKQELRFKASDSLKVRELMAKNDQKSKEDLHSLIEKMKDYKIDTIQFQKDHELSNITDSFFRNIKDIKKEQEENIDKRIILHGMFYQITVEDLIGGDLHTLHAHSPTEKYHPEMFKLISIIRKIYSQFQK